jgi:hypothetical protein
VRNRLVLGAIVGQALVTLVAVGYGASAHSSWEVERQRRLDGERAAVAEMATAMQAANDRLATIEQELKRCQARARRLSRRPPPAPAPPPAVAPAHPETSSALGDEAAFEPLAGPIAWSATARRR